MRERYRAQVALLVRTLPAVAREAVFALKGGTAINLFLRDLPRLSVDIDLTYLPVEDRARSLASIDAALRRIGARVLAAAPASRISYGASGGERFATKALIAEAGAQIKIEVTPVIRGCVLPPEIRPVSPAVEDTFGYAECAVVSFADLYAGKIVAALDRQHPRDLFDVRDLLANEGITDALRTAFLVYLVSHNRPMAEVLQPTFKDIRQEFESGFAGMTRDAVALNELEAARSELIQRVVTGMPADHRRFLLSFKAGEPDWSLLAIPHAQELPAVRWKLENLARLPPRKREVLLGNLRRVLDL
jgi:Nucleotidyl transferase AbiEii toxin, Type IV TA system